MIRSDLRDLINRHKPIERLNNNNSNNNNNNNNNKCKCNLSYKVQKEIPLRIDNASYDTHFMLNQLAIEFKGELNCIGYNMKRYITFFVPIKKELNNGKTITYKLKFIDSVRFMQTSLSELVDNTSEIFKSK